MRRNDCLAKASLSEAKINKGICNPSVGKKSMELIWIHQKKDFFHCDKTLSMYFKKYGVIFHSDSLNDGILKVNI